MFTSNTPKAELFQPENLSEITMEKILDNMEENCKLALSLIFDQIHAIKKMRELSQNYQSKIQQLQEEVGNLKMVISSKDDKIQELECLAYFESPNGDAICNSNWLD